MAAPALFDFVQLPLFTRLLVRLARCWPARRGRMRLRQLVARSLEGTPRLVEARLAQSRLTVLAPWADSVGNVIVTFGDNEPDVFRFLRCCLECRRPEENLFVDIGANLGIFSLRIAERFRDTKVLSFEPNPTIAALLRENAARNGLAPRLEVREMALGDRDVATRLNIVPGDSGVSSVTDALGAGEPIEMRRLATEISLEDWKRIAVIKIDVEGYELGVFQAAEPLFARHLPVVIFEVNRPELATRGVEPRVLGDFLRRFGYEKILAVGCVLYPSANGLFEVCNIAAFPAGREQLIESYGFDQKYQPQPESMWPVCHFEV